MFADPKTKDDIIEKLKANVKVLEDENGVTCSVIPLKDGALPAHMVLAGMSGPMGMKKQDIRNMPIRDDDIIVIDYPKTGKISKKIYKNLFRFSHNSEIKLFYRPIFSW